MMGNHKKNGQIIHRSSEFSGCIVNVVPHFLHLRVLLPTISSSFDPHFGHE